LHNYRDDSTTKIRSHSCVYEYDDQYIIVCERAMSDDKTCVNNNT